MHQTFQSGNVPHSGFSLCSFVPVMAGWHPLEVPAPYAHFNVDSDELMFFCNPFYGAREGVVEEGSFTFHPGSTPHSPQGKAAERSLAARGKVQGRLAVMLDTYFESMRITTHGFAHRDPGYVDPIADDMAAWAGRTAIDVDVIFAPAQPAVRPLAEALGARLRRPTAYWEYLPSGRYGERLVEGSVLAGSRALALNGVSLQARCVGLRLPQFLERLGGRSVAAAVFAKGVADLVRQTEEKMGDRFYSTLQVNVPIYPASSCPLCASSAQPPMSWREFAEGPR